MSENNYFTALANINVNDKTEKKNNLTYLSWAWAWGEIKKRHPDATYTIYENKDGWNYHTDGRTCWVKTGMMVQGIEHIEYLPVMDYRNASISADKVTSFDVNKAIQRSLTKAAARHGLGLYIYAGEDLPDDGEEKPVPASKLSETGESKYSRQEAPSQPAEAPKPADKPEQDIRTERIKALCKYHNITSKVFNDYMKELKLSGKVPNKQTKDMTDQDFNVALSLVHTALNETRHPA